MKKDILSKSIIGLAIIISAFLIGRAYMYKDESKNVISVTGLAQENFVSDLITWNASFVVKDMNLPNAYVQLKKNNEEIKSYLKKKGFNVNDFTFYSVDIQKQFRSEKDEKGNYSSHFDGYALTQNFGISSKKVNQVEALSREITELINDGIEINSNAPEYYYTKLDALKIKMLKAAAQDANLRATTIADNGGGKIGNLKNSSMGVFQITGLNSSEDYSWGGSFNTSSKEKTASITVRFEYELN